MDGIDQIIKKYSKAFLNIYSDSLKIEDLKKIDDLIVFFKKQKNLLFYFQQPIISIKIKNKFLSELLTKFDLTDKLKDGLHTLLFLLIKHKKVDLLPFILKSIKDLYQKYNNIIQFNIFHSHILSEEQKNNLINFLKESTGKEIISYWEIDKSLIAGLKIISSTLGWEYSIKQQLMSLGH